MTRDSRVVAEFDLRGPVPGFYVEEKLRRGETRLPEGWALLVSDQVTAGAVR